MWCLRGVPVAVAGPATLLSGPAPALRTLAVTEEGPQSRDPTRQTQTAGACSSQREAPAWMTLPAAGGFRGEKKGCIGYNRTIKKEKEEEKEET